MGTLFTQKDKSTNQNSGVRIDAYDTNGEKDTYYGWIEEIWELDYGPLKVPLFRCKWVGLDDVKINKHGMTIVELGLVAYEEKGVRKVLTGQSDETCMGTSDRPMN